MPKASVRSFSTTLCSNLNRVLFFIFQARKNKAVCSPPYSTNCLPSHLGSTLEWLVINNRSKNDAEDSQGLY